MLISDGLSDSLVLEIKLFVIFFRILLHKENLFFLLGVVLFTLRTLLWVFLKVLSLVALAFLFLTLSTVVLLILDIIIPLQTVRIDFLP